MASAVMWVVARYVLQCVAVCCSVLQCVAVCSIKAVASAMWVEARLSFLKVSSLLNLIYQMTIKQSIENICQDDRKERAHAGCTTEHKCRSDS